jgi:large subunit ribosomal protein L4
MKTDIYTIAGKKNGTLDLPEAVFGVAWNEPLVHQVAVSMQANKRTPVAHTKDRSEVAGGGKKPWKQKGTGRARHGSSRSPIWVGGGVAHGPRNEKSYAKKINKNMRAKALYTVLSQKAKDSELVLVDSFTLSTPSAKTAKGALMALQKAGFDGLASRRNNAALVVLSGKDIPVAKSFQNFGNIAVTEARNVNVLDVLSAKYVVLVNAEEAVQHIAQRLA